MWAALLRPVDLNYHQDLHPASERNWGFRLEHLQQFHPISVVETFPVASLPTTEPAPPADSDYWTEEKDYTHITNELAKLASTIEPETFKGLAANQRPDPDGFPMDCYSGLSRLTQAFTFDSYRNTIRLYNFGLMPMSKEKLAQTANAIRSMEQKTGGTLSEALAIIAILPGGHPALTQRENKGMYNSGGAQAFLEHGLILISERELREPDTTYAPPAIRHESPMLERVSARRQERFLTQEQREAKERRAQLKLIASLNRQDKLYEQILAHEFTHMLTPRYYQVLKELETTVGDEPAFVSVWELSMARLARQTAA